MLLYKHIPVLRDEIVSWLITNRQGVYCDCTLGGGGHALAILQNLDAEGRLIGIDRDTDAITAAQKHLDELKLPNSIQLIQSDFTGLRNFILPDSLTGILFDLGVSSYQLDTPERGFSFRESGPLDMRMNQNQEKTAETIINTTSEKELAHIFFTYGEERQSRRIARKIVDLRKNAPIQTTQALTDLVRSVVGEGPKSAKSFARIFQALRIAVNDELNQLEKAIIAAIDCLQSGGRIAVISYHSLEDRIVKNIFRVEEKGCICPPRLPKCICGKTPTVRRLTKKIITPSTAEIARNHRARSARLRVAERI